MTEMGNVEKWVVLGVLALIVGILVVSLNVDDPLKKDKVVQSGSVDAPAVAAADLSQPAPKADAGSALLNASVNTAAPAPVAPAAIAPAIPSGSILKTMDGLQESYMSDAMFYTWKSGDTFASVASRFYGDPSRLATLKRLNEGRSDVQPGERVLIAVYDLDGSPAPAVAPAEAADKKVAGTPAKPEAPVATPVAAASGTARSHLVKDGESLWKIAKQELGSGARWNEIYTANRDVLSSPEALHTGQKLRIP
jgi:nucleoid-associated protein YgaU